MTFSTCKLFGAGLSLILLSACGVGSADISVIAAPSAAPNMATLSAAPAQGANCSAECAPPVIDGLAEQARMAAQQRQGEADSAPVYPRVAANAVELREPRTSVAFGTEGE